MVLNYRPQWRPESNTPNGNIKDSTDINLDCDETQNWYKTLTNCIGRVCEICIEKNLFYSNLILLNDSAIHIAGLVHHVYLVLKGHYETCVFGVCNICGLGSNELVVNYPVDVELSLLIWNCSVEMKTFCLGI